MTDKKISSKPKWSDLSFKDKLSSVLCLSSFWVGVILIFVGLLLPPIGEVSGSVLTGVGFFLTFCGSLIGINNHYKFETQKMKADVESAIEKTLRKKNIDDEQ